MTCLDMSLQVSLVKKSVLLYHTEERVTLRHAELGCTGPIVNRANAASDVKKHVSGTRIGVTVEFILDIVTGV